MNSKFSFHFTSLSLLVCFLALNSCQENNSITQMDGNIISELELPEHLTSMPPQTTTTKGLSAEWSADLLASSLCCDCTMSITNLSPIYRTAVSLAPYWNGDGLCGPLSIQAILDPAGMPNSTKSASNKARSVGFDGTPNIFNLNAVNIENESDCIRLRIVINCGLNTYDESFTTDPTFNTGDYYVAQFDVDSEGQPESCNLVPLNLSWRCRNASNQVDCLPVCNGLSTGG